MFVDKLNKKLFAVLIEEGFETPTELQLKCVSKINSGVDVIAVAPALSGKSTLITICTIQKLQTAVEDAPRAIILVANMDKALSMKAQFDLFTKETDLRVLCMFEEGKINKQSVEVYEGADVVIGTAKRVHELYFNHSLNVNKLKLFIIDDAELMIKNAWQSPVDRLGESLPKCQHLVFTNEYTVKVEKLIHKFIVVPSIIDVTV